MTPPTDSPIIPAHVEPVPPPKGWALVWKHLQNWQSIYLFIPLSLTAIWGFSKAGYLITGREPTENIDWIVGVAGNLVKLVFLVVFSEVERQQTGNWWKPELLIANPHLGWQQSLTKCVTLLVGAYILSH